MELAHDPLGTQDIEERSKSVARFRFLAEASAVLSSSLDYRTTLKSIADLAVPFIADVCVVDILTPEGQTQRLAAAHINPEKSAWIQSFHKPNPGSRTGVFEVIRTGKTLFFSRVPEHVLFDGQGVEQVQLIKRENIKSYMCVALKSRTQILGAISFLTGQSNRILELEDVDVAEQLAVSAGIAIENARLYSSELKRYSTLALENARLFASANDALRTREEFMSVASHELRTPLTALLLQQQMLLRRASKQPELMHLSASIAKCERYTRRLSGLVDTLLDVSRIRSGQLVLDRQNIDLVAIIHDAISQFDEPVQVETSSDVVLGNCDPLRMLQVTTNLISNAIKYGEGKPVRVIISKTKSAIRLAVEDQGIGISEELQNTIFDCFARGKTSSYAAGLGLGLYIVKEICTAHGGSVSITSQIGKGSTFTVELPA